VREGAACVTGAPRAGVPEPVPEKTDTRTRAPEPMSAACWFPCLPAPCAPRARALSAGSRRR